MAEEQSPEMKLVAQVPTEKLLARVKRNQTERKIKQEKRLIAIKIRIDKKRQLVRQEKQLVRQAEQRKGLRSLKKGFRSLLGELSSDYLDTNLASVPRDELVILPDLVAVRAKPRAVLQGIVGAIAPLAALKGFALLVASQGGIGNALAALGFGGLIGICGLLLTMMCCIIANVPPSVFCQKLDAIFSFFKFRSLRYIYRYYRLKNKLGPEEYVKYLQNMNR